MTRVQILDQLKDQRTRCEIWTRVMGYHRPVHTFNPGKQGEHADRVLFEESRVNAQSRGSSVGSTPGL